MKKNKSVKLVFFEDQQIDKDIDSWQIEATVSAGVSLTLIAEKTPIEKEFVTLRDESSAAEPDSAHDIRTIARAKWDGVAAWFRSSQNSIFAACIVIYLLIRFIGLMDYPVYFNFDEADPTTMASDFLRDGFRNIGGEFLPAFFQNPGGNYNVGSAAVYLQILPLLIFGRSAYVIRVTSVLIGLIGAICVSLALRDIFRVRYWWAGILVLSAIPAWFHHSRTAYEMPTFASMYSAMLYCYWLYRFRNPNYLYLTVIFATIAFYDYSPGQALIPLTVVALLILDFRHHLRLRFPALGAALLGILCVLPYVRFQIEHFGSSAQTMANVGSYWVDDLTLTEKIGAFLARYLFHLSPSYWFTPAYDVTPTDGLLHIMKGYGHLGLLLLPFLLWGLWLLARRLRQPEYRILLAALLIAPVSASLVTSPSSITRAMVMVIPAALIASIGLDDLLRMLAARLHPGKSMLIPAALLTVLLSINFYMLWDVLNNGVTWFDNNQEKGVQFGANKVFPALMEEWKIAPNAPAVISPQWAMFSGIVARIYLGDEANIAFNSIYDYARRRQPLEDATIFVVTPEEFEFSTTSPKFSDIQVLRTIPYSKTKMGFYFIRLKYSPQADALLAAENAELRKLVPGEVLINGQTVQVAYSRDTDGVIQYVFDDNLDSLFKTFEINPALFELTFPQEQEFRSIFIIHGGAPIELKVTFFPTGEGEPKTYTEQFWKNGDIGNTLNLDQTVKAIRVNISVQVLSADESGTVHIWEITFNK